MESPNSRCALFALLGMCVALGWQYTTVTANYGGNWTALFETGALARVPDSLAGEHIFRFGGSSGYDGQAYHLIAHDPLLRNANIRAAVDDPGLRYRRILVPGLAWLFAIGQAGGIDAAYIAVCLLFIGLGVYCSAQLCARHEFPPAYGLAFLLAPAVLVTIDRMVVDAALAALTVAFLLLLDRPGRRLWLVLAAAALTRETGVLLVIACCGSLALRRKWRTLPRYASAVIPAAAWYVYVASRARAEPYPERFTPLTSIVAGMLHPQAYPPGTPLAAWVQAGDVLALAGALAAFSLAFYLFAGPRRFEPDALAALGFALLGVFSQRPDQWWQVFDFGRVYTPLLLLLAAQALRTRQVYWVAPWLMMLPRVAMQFAPQALGIVR